MEARNAILVLEQKNVIISVDSATVPPQEQFDINITIVPNGNKVYGVEYYLKYNTSVVRAESQVKGPFLGPASDTIVVVNDIDRTNGKVSYAETRKVPGGVTDPGVSSVIQFTAIGEAGDCTNLNLSGVIIVDTANGKLNYTIKNGKACISTNHPPTASGGSKHWINNAQKKFECLAELYSNSTDLLDGDDIVYIRWAFGDGEYGTSEGILGDCPSKKHSYTSWKWVPFGDPNGDYEPFEVHLTVTDNGVPPLEDETSFNVTVYMAGDANGDGRVNIQDAALVGLNWGKTATDTCGYIWGTDIHADEADLNNDCKVDILDAVIVGTLWGHTAWY
ncbi:hypothetical protein DRN98_07415 [Methanosarcinales archaeon]|nr:MAG: hypothetical protein DRN98_07415 [Methanosarcinales archaeon]